MKTFFKTVGVLAAPWSYALGRLIGNPQVSAWSARLDNNYGRGYEQYASAQGLSSSIMGTFSNAAKLCALSEAGTDEVIKELFSNSHSQILQDIVCALIHNRKESGYFVEVGVGNGRDLSNTLMLERDFGWSGILAEPSRSFHESIRNTRSAIIDTRAVFNVTGEKVLLEEVAGVGELSGLSGYRSARGKQDITTYEVDTVTLEDLLTEYKAPSQIDYISIDTEGTELEILKGLNLAKRRVSFFSIEHNHDLQKLDAIRSILLPAGYQEILKEISLCDAWFVHQDLPQHHFKEV